MSQQLTVGLSLAGTWPMLSPSAKAPFELAAYQRAVRYAEAAKADFVFLPDAVFLNRAALSERSRGFTSLDPLVLLAALVTSSDTIGMIPTVHSLLSSPFRVARQLQSLNLLSGGRVGWNVVTALGGVENFGVPGELSSEDRYRKAAEFIEVVRGLWQSYPAEAVELDRVGDYTIAETALRNLDHHGEFFSSKGPLNVPALAGPAQRMPILQAGGSPSGQRFAARFADAVFAAAPILEQAVQQREQLREYTAEAGRDPDQVKFLPGLSLHLTEIATEDQATGDSSGESAVPSARHWSFRGTPEQAAKEIIRWFEADAIDGFIALPAGSWDSVRLFAEQLVPLLARAGVFRSKYSGSTLAEHFSLGQ